MQNGVRCAASAVPRGSIYPNYSWSPHLYFSKPPLTIETSRHPLRMHLGFQKDRRLKLSEQFGIASKSIIRFIFRKRTESQNDKFQSPSSDIHDQMATGLATSIALALADSNSALRFPVSSSRSSSHVNHRKASWTLALT
jgi:hypothetical protein